MALHPDSDQELRYHLHLAESAELMAGTDFWKLLVRALAIDEANRLIALEQYLRDEAHPDREEVMTLALKWHACRSQRRILLDNVRDYRAMLIATEQEPTDELNEMLAVGEL